MAKLSDIPDGTPHHLCTAAKRACLLHRAEAQGGVGMSYGMGVSFIHAIRASYQYEMEVLQDLAEES